MSYKFNPFTGNLDIVGEGGTGSVENFSYTLVPEGQTVTIPENQQMLVDGQLRVRGDLIVRGGVVDVFNPNVGPSFYDLIPENDCVKILVNRLMMFNGQITVRGHLRVDGRLVQV